DRPRGGSFTGRRGPCRHPGGDPEPRQGGEPGRDSPQYRGAPEVVAGPPARPRQVTRPRPPAPCPPPPAPRPRATRPRPRPPPPPPAAPRPPPAPPVEFRARDIGGARGALGRERVAEIVVGPARHEDVLE